MNKVSIPTVLRKLSAGQDFVDCQGKTVEEVLNDLERQHPGFRERIMTGTGVNRFINLYVNGDDIRFLDGVNSSVKDGDEVAIIPSISGG
jgi:sulfur-carrier protein